MDLLFVNRFLKFIRVKQNDESDGCNSTNVTKLLKKFSPRSFYDDVATFIVPLSRQLHATGLPSDSLSSSSFAKMSRDIANVID
jgi:hypothetical protein